MIPRDAGDHGHDCLGVLGGLGGLGGLGVGIFWGGVCSCRGRDGLRASGGGLHASRDGSRPGDSGGLDGGGGLDDGGGLDGVRSGLGRALGRLLG